MPSSSKADRSKTPEPRAAEPRKVALPGPVSDTQPTLFANRWLVACTLGVVTVIAFVPALRCGFVNFDDPHYITENQGVMGGLSGKAVAWAFTTYYQANWHPLTWLSLQFDASLWGENAFGYHLTNVLLHAGNAALLYLALRALTGAAGRSFAVALLFAVHPLRAESVAWVSERKDVLSLFFGFLALWAYAVYVRAPSVWRSITVASFFALSLMAKPTLVTLPCLLLVLDWWPLCRWRSVGARQLFREKLLLFGLTAASCVMSVLSQASRGAVLSKEMIPLATRLGNALVAYIVYPAKTVWPLQLAPLYPHPALMPSGLEPATVLAAAVILVAVTATAFVMRRRASYLLSGWLWYLGTLVPVLGLVQVGGQAYADRYTYFPQIGLLIVACWGVNDLLQSRPRTAFAALAMAASVLAALNWQQQGYWKDSVALWEHDVATVGPSHVALFNLGEGLEKQNRLPEAAERFRQALTWNPQGIEAHFQLGRVLQSMGHLDEAMQQFEEVCQLNQDRADAHNRLGDLFRRQNKLDEAARHYETSLGINRKDPGTLCNLAVVEMARDHADRAAGYYREALEADPKSPEARNGLGSILIRQGRVDEGMEELRTVIRNGIRAGQAHNNLGKALEDKGDFAGAAGHYEEASRLSPELGLVWYNLGRMREREGRDAEAVECFEKAAAKDRGSPERHVYLIRALDNHAAKLAAAKRFDEAAAAARRARDLAAAAGRQELVKQIEARIQGYQRGEAAPGPGGGP
jgi:tetratricopeptide (TPR) repeat protein